MSTEKLPAIIPIKTIRLGKSRLSYIFNEDERIHLINLLISITISELKKSSFIHPIILVSGDYEVKALAEKEDLIFLYENNSGVNNAVKIADSYCMKSGYNSNIIIPHDIPFISSKSVDKICQISFYYEKCIFLCPSLRMDGTNILLRKPVNLIHTCYDDDSYNQHFNLAKKSGAVYKSLFIKNLMFDIDDITDISFFLENIKDYEKISVGVKSLFHFLKSCKKIKY
ncbi:MAG: hypothetical protein DA328_07050 [Nitrososphaeraceae archaeon]|nr:hypothetical protein [Nitrososphaeraceae archaeon]